MHSFRPVILLLLLFRLSAQETPPVKAKEKPVWSASEFLIYQQLRGIRFVEGKKHWTLLRSLTSDIKRLPPTPNKLILASTLGEAVTEGDAGQELIQEVADVLAAALREQPLAPPTTGPAKKDPPRTVTTPAYRSLARLVHYEGAKQSLDAPALEEAIRLLAAEDTLHAKAEFTLADLAGKQWSLQALQGKVVLINFWATWCPPCRKEMPALSALHKKLSPKGLVILAISDEDAVKVKTFVSKENLPFAVLLDPGSALHKQLQIDSIPKTLIFDREGKMVAKAVDERSQRQLEAMLAKAGLN